MLLALLPLFSGCESIESLHRTGSPLNDQKVPVLMAGKIITRSTAVATVRAPITSSKVGLRVFRDRSLRLISGTTPRTRFRTDWDAQSPPAPGSEAFERLLDDEGLPLRTSGKVQFYVDGKSFFPVFHKAIKDAQERVDVQAYIFDTDPFAAEVAALLKQKSHEVPVRVYFDWVGSLLASRSSPEGSSPAPFASPKELAAYLKKDSQVQVRTTANPYMVADHTKLHVIDGRIAFMGGMNIGAEYRYTWHDMMARVEGPVVERLASLYEDHWGQENWWQKVRSGPEHTARGNSAEPAGTDGRSYPPLRMLVTDTPHGKREILKAALVAIHCARQRVWIETPYLSCDEITDALADAVKRGVDVRVIIPSSPDQKVAQKFNAAELASLLQTGAKAYEYPGMTHLKAMICDGWMMFGSANCDTLSMRINRELTLAGADPGTVRHLAAAVFEKDFSRSKALTVEAARAKGGIFAEVIGDQL